MKCIRLAAPTLALLLLPAGLLLAADEKPKPLRYLKPEKGKLVLESDVTETQARDGTSYVSLTDRGTEKMTLTVQFDKTGQVTSASAVRESNKGKESATLKLADGKARLEREGGIIDLFKVAGNPVVTTAPDWSDIFLLVRRYDGKKGGKQEFPGLWIHPTRPHLTLTFSVERLGADTITVAERKLQLERYRIHLRSGDYLVWADSTRRVVKLFPAGKPAAFVVLEGYDEATGQLGIAPKK